MKLILQDLSGNVIVYNVLDAKLVDMMAMSYLVSIDKLPYYNMDPIYFEVD